MAARLQRQRIVIGVVRRIAARDLDQPELDVLDRQVAARLAVEIAQCLRRLLRTLGRAGQRKIFRTPRDDDVQRGLDLAQILVKHAAQIGEALVVDGFE
jgi:hypothetical protein